MLTREAFKDWTKEQLEKGFPNSVIEEKMIEKLNGSYLGLIPLVADEPVSPCINLTAMYEDYQAGKSLADIESMLSKLPEEVKANRPDQIVFQCYEEAKKHLGLRVTSKDNPALKKIPHKIYEDLAVCGVYVDETTGDYQATATVTDAMCKMWEVSEETLLHDAFENAVKRYPVSINRLSDLLGISMMDEDCPIYCVSTKQMICGAAALFYPGALPQIAKILHGSFFVIPSSIHEMLVVPDTFATTANALKDMVQSANDTVLSKEDILSYSVYHYDADQDIFELAEKYEKRCEMDSDVSKMLS